MPEQRRKFSPQFKAEAVQMVIETGKPVAEVATTRPRTAMERRPRWRHWPRLDRARAWPGRSDWLRVLPTVEALQSFRLPELTSRTDFESWGSSNGYVLVLRGPSAQDDWGHSSSSSYPRTCRRSIFSTRSGAGCSDSTLVVSLCARARAMSTFGRLVDPHRRAATARHATVGGGSRTGRPRNRSLGDLRRAKAGPWC